MTLSPLKLLAIVGVVLLAGLVWMKKREIERADPRRQTGENGIVMLGAEWCGYCRKLKAALDAAEVPYTEMDVEDGGAGHDAFVALGGRGVPVTVIGQDVVYGYNTGRLDELLSARGHSVRLQ
ncbi:MAG TPA: glutaredoxin domain-containing protein [Tahibacter sp.]|uniref:glutaredoxin family protein n=1 Tax=Tahibacter sp. TaxID=2056211 RepID=UPI002C9A5BE0|nr:glutaredoxin domain-containing protein [Tahibacter sp.]HSX59602.1 glutaredoxin domain-containing protein [Tahibacter sp.]